MHMPSRTPEDLHALLAAAMNQGDIDAFVEAFEDDAVHVVPPTGARTVGKAALRAALEPTFALHPTARMEVVGKLEGDGFALTHGRWQLVLTHPDGRREHLKGRGTIVSRRRSDGTWRIVLDDPMTPR
ncbi:YybH family protein [Pseudonocardia adelaidensis]|uniref:SnoaL-like domain-containing protein n=1 Tax=Pseudonocardia adelaidensis TaxID=648754 RepID=A0ABP9NP49_9PSEU